MTREPPPRFAIRLTDEERFERAECATVVFRLYNETSKSEWTRSLPNALHVMFQSDMNARLQGAKS